MVIDHLCHLAGSVGFQVDSCPGRVRNAGRGRPLHTRTVFVNQFTSDCCLGLIMWLELTRKRISMILSSYGREDS